MIPYSVATTDDGTEMSYLLIVFSEELQVSTFETKEEASRGAEAWNSLFPDVKVIVAKTIAENKVNVDINGEDRESETIDGISTSNDLNLLACLKHLIDEGGMDNFLETRLAGIVMKFFAGNGDVEMEWHIHKGDSRSNQYWGLNEGSSLVERGFVREIDTPVDSYWKLVPVASLTDLVVVVREASEIMRDLFHAKDGEHWHISNQS